jgi:hypothetical protein
VDSLLMPASENLHTSGLTCKLLIKGLAQSAELVHYSVAFPLIRECPHNSTNSKKARGNVIER